MRGTAYRLLAFVLVLAGCSEEREQSQPPSVYADVEPIFEGNCAECHSSPEPAANYSVDDYFSTIGCVPGGRPATLPPNDTAPILAILSEPSHTGFLDPSQDSALMDWVVEGAWPERDGSHPGQWMDPRTDAWHGTYLRETEWQPIVDPTRGDACGLCHAGSPAPVPGVTSPAPGATDCTTCHDLPGGVMACGTCHGDGLRPYPPRDQCYFPGPPFGGAHMAHTVPSANLRTPLSCQACHFGQDYEMLDGTHGNDEVNVIFQPAWGPNASYDFDTLVCATTCHIRGGGTTPDVAWDEELALDCNSCHRNPPAGHAQVACNRCHLGINPTGTQLTKEAPHINGRVDAF